MFFTKAGRIIAWIVFVFGMAVFTSSVALAFSGNENYAAVPAYGMTIGQLTNVGALTLLLGVGLGVLIEISCSLSAIKEYHTSGTLARDLEGQHHG